MNRNDTDEGKIGTVDDSEDDNDGNDDGSSDKDYCSFAFFFAGFFEPSLQIVTDVDSDIMEIWHL